MLILQSLKVRQYIDEMTEYRQVQRTSNQSTDAFCTDHMHRSNLLLDMLSLVI